MVLCWLDRNTCESSDTARRQQIWTGLSSQGKEWEDSRIFIIHTSGHTLDMDLHHCFRSFPRQVWAFFHVKSPSTFRPGHVTVKKAPPHDPAAFPMQLLRDHLEPNTDIKKTKTMWPHRNGERKRPNWWRWTDELWTCDWIGHQIISGLLCVSWSLSLHWYQEHQNIITHFHKAKLWNGFKDDLSSNIPYWLDWL